MASSSHQVWLITGCSSGFGRVLARIAAEKGHVVIGTLRNPSQIQAFNDLVPGKTIGVLMDVTNRQQINEGVAAAITGFGRIDVLVNNAGYGLLGPIEEVSDKDLRHQFEVNVFGAIALIQEVLPHMRKQRSGRILNISSIAGMQGYAGVGIYNASKFALEGMNAALAQEVRHLGIYVTSIKPGPFRTNWAGASATYVSTSIPDYSESAGVRMKGIQSVDGKQPGDPEKGCQAIYTLSQMDDPPINLMLGGVAYDRVRERLTELSEEIDKYEYLGRPTDFDG